MLTIEIVYYPVSLGDFLRSFREGKLFWWNCVLNSFSSVWLFATPWTVAHQSPLSMGFSKHTLFSKNTGVVSMPSPRRSSRSRVESMSLNIFCIGRRVLYHENHLGSPEWNWPPPKISPQTFLNIEMKNHQKSNLKPFVTHKWKILYLHSFFMS